MSRIALALAVVGLLAATAVAGAHPATIQVVSKQTTMKPTANGFTFTETLRKGAKVVGHDKVACTVVASPVVNCVGTFTFKKGTVKVKGRVDNSKTINTIKIVGGTKAYKGAKGTLTLLLIGEAAYGETLAFK